VHLGHVYFGTALVHLHVSVGCFCDTGFRTDVHRAHAASRCRSDVCALAWLSQLDGHEAQLDEFFASNFMVQLQFSGEMAGSQSGKYATCCLRYQPPSPPDIKVRTA